MKLRIYLTLENDIKHMPKNIKKLYLMDATFCIIYIVFYDYKNKKLNKFHKFYKFSKKIVYNINNKK